MQLGNHFGKRKPGWNIFNEKTRLYFQSIENSVLKVSLFSSTVQFLVLAPLLYWTMENYNLFSDIIPIQMHLKEYLDAERKWILSLFLFTYLISIFLNYQILKMISLKIHKSIILTRDTVDKNTNDHIFLIDEVDVRHRAF
jgi:hypothetical protein